MAEDEDAGKPTKRYVVAGVAVALIALLGGGAYLLWPSPADHVLVVGDSVSYLSI